LRKVTEHEEQALVIKWFDLAYKDFRGRLYANPNGGKRHVVTAVKLKKEGARKGIPDLSLPVSRHGFHGLYIELKAKGGRLSTEQADWLHFLSEQGYLAVLCVGFDAAKKTIEDYLV